jgi:hypothetical protein
MPQPQSGRKRQETAPSWSGPGRVTLTAPTALPDQRQRTQREVRPRAVACRRACAEMRSTTLDNISIPTPVVRNHVAIGQADWRVSPYKLTGMASSFPDGRLLCALEQLKGFLESAATSTARGAHGSRPSRGAPAAMRRNRGCSYGSVRPRVLSRVNVRTEHAAGIPPPTPDHGHGCRPDC